MSRIIVAANDKLSSHGELLCGEAQCFLGDIKAHAVNLDEDATGMNGSHITGDITFTFTHADIGRLAGVGFRIQAYTDNNARTAKAAAQQRARDIAMKFPQYRSYISYKAPSWRLRIGDFKTQREAQAALQRIKSVYPKFAREMVIVRDRINVWSND